MVLKGKIAFITGAARGNTGEGIAKVMAEKGATVIVVGRSEKVFEAAEWIGSQAYGYITDVTDFAKVKAVADEVLKTFGHVDILVNNAAISRFINALNMDDDMLELQWNTNVKSAWNCTKALIPQMLERKYGRIINLSSTTGTRVCDPGMLGYGTSKGAVLAFTKALAIDVIRKGITVNAILPGGIDSSGMLQELFENMNPENPQEAKAQIESTIPIGRLASTREIGYLAAFLASDEAAYITGTELLIDGGLTLPESGQSFHS